MEEPVADGKSMPCITPILLPVAVIVALSCGTEVSVDDTAGTGELSEEVSELPTHSGGHDTLDDCSQRSLSCTVNNNEVTCELAVIELNAKLDVSHDARTLCQNLCPEKLMLEGILADKTDCVHHVRIEGPICECCSSLGDEPVTEKYCDWDPCTEDSCEADTCLHIPWSWIGSSCTTGDGCPGAWVCDESLCLNPTACFPDSIRRCERVPGCE